MFIFTGGDSLAHHGKEVDEFVKECPEFLQELISKCGNHYLAINNFAIGDDKVGEQKQIIRVVKKIITENNGQFYSNEIYASLTEKLQERLRAQQSKKKSKPGVSFLDSIRQKIIDNQDEINEYLFLVAKLLGGLALQFVVGKAPADLM